MLKIKIIAVGKLKETYWQAALAEYQKRLGRYCQFFILEVDDLPEPKHMGEKQKETLLWQEGERILKQIKPGSCVIPLCIEGKQLSSEEFAELFTRLENQGISEVDFIIGGSNGLSEEVKRKAFTKLSFSKMTFPHQIARVLLCEQIYRAFKIKNGETYHK